MLKIIEKLTIFSFASLEFYLIYVENYDKFWILLFAFLFLAWLFWSDIFGEDDKKEGKDNDE